MKPKETLKLSLANGQVTAIYSDAHADVIAKASAVTVTRVSNVEPDPKGGWTATMTDGTVLGPFRLRQTALDEEVKYLESKLF